LLDALFINLLELGVKGVLVCTKYTGALDRGTVPTLGGFLVSRVLTNLMTVMVVEEGFGLHLANS